MNNGENLTVLVVAHNRLEYTKKTLESLFRTVPKACFLVYNNSPENVELSDYLFNEMMKEEDREMLIMNAENGNVGWGKAINDAVSQIQAFFPTCGCGVLHDLNREYILLSNNDVEYFDGWYDKCLEAYATHPEIGILGVWKHIHHGVKDTIGNIVVKDQMPAVGWLLKPEFMHKIGPVRESGPCDTKGGNGEDVDYCIRAAHAGYLVCGLKEDVANHLDGY